MKASIFFLLAVAMVSCAGPAKKSPVKPSREVATIVGGIDTKNEPENFFVCQASIEQNGKVIFKRFATSYWPDPQNDSEGPAYHSTGITSHSTNCFSQVNNDSYNKKYILRDRKGKNYIDLCYTLLNSNSSITGKGQAEFFLVSRSIRDYFKTAVLPGSSPLKFYAPGTQESIFPTKNDGTFKLNVSCDNKMIPPMDEFWEKIRLERNRS